MAFGAVESRFFFARVKNNIDERYTPSMTYGPGGIVIEPGFVRNQDGKAYFFLTNAYDYPINIEIPVIKLMSVERYYEILSLEAQNEDKINAQKESENFVPRFDKEERNPSDHENFQKERNPSSHENFVPSFDKEEKNPSFDGEEKNPSFDEEERNPSSQENYVSSIDGNEKNPSFDKNKKNPSSLEKFVSNNVEKEKSSGNRESFVSSFGKKEKSSSNHEKINPSSEETFISSFGKNEKNLGNYENVKKEKNLDSLGNTVSSIYNQKKKPGSRQNFVSSCNKSEKSPGSFASFKNEENLGGHDDVKKQENSVNLENIDPESIITFKNEPKTDLELCGKITEPFNRNNEKFTQVETIWNPPDSSAQEFLEPLVGMRFMPAADCLTVHTEAVDHLRVQQIYDLLRLKHLDKEEVSVVQELITEAADIFYLPGEKLGTTDVLVHRIPTIDEFPVNSKQYRFPEIHKDEINRQVQEQLEGGIIREFSSSYNTPIWIVSKKNDSHGNKKWRWVLDFSEHNEKTIADAYPLPNIVDILDQLDGANYFSVFDLASGFHQINMQPDDCPKTALTTPYGHYEYVRMPMGLRYAASVSITCKELIL